MKNFLSNFGNDALSKSEMRNVVGGILSDDCQICSSGTNGGACGAALFSQSEANAIVSDLNKRNDGYTYFKSCN